MSILCMKRCVDWLDNRLPTVKGRPFVKEVIDNVKPGFTVALLSMPLSISLSVAGGGNPRQGVVNAIWASMISGFLGSCHYNIQGPTGGLTGVLSMAAIKYGDSILPLLAVLGGLLSLTAVLLTLDRYVLFLPSPVVHGFTIGVAVIIGGNQINNAFGLKAPHVPPPTRHFYVNVLNSIKAIPHTDPYTFLTFICFFLFLLIMSRKFPRVPWSLVVAPIGCLLGYYSTKGSIPNYHMVTLGSKYDCQPTVWIGLSFPHHLDTEEWFDCVLMGISVAFVGMLETLITARIADGMTNDYSPPRREAFGNAIANIGCGFAGGVPCAGGLARTALNIRAGATSRMSIIINAFVMIVMASTLLEYFQHYPLACVAAQVSIVAFNMLQIKQAKHLWRMDRVAFGLTYFVAFVCVFRDPTSSIIVGTMLGLLRFASAMSSGHAEITLTAHAHQTMMRLASLDGFQKVDLIPDDILTNKSYWRRLGKKLASPLQSLRRHLDVDKDVEEASIERSKGIELPASQRQSTAGIPPQEEENSGIVVYRIVGKMTYINAQRHQIRVKIFRTRNHVKYLVLSLRYVHYVDVDGVDAIGSIIGSLEYPDFPEGDPPEHKVMVAIAGIQRSCLPLIAKSQWYKTKVEAELVFTSHKDALATLTNTPQAPEIVIEGEQVDSDSEVAPIPLSSRKSAQQII